MTVALELQPCLGNRSGVGTYAYELAKRLKSGDSMEFVGNVFNFLGRNDNAASINGIEIPIRESRIFPYGIYRRIWDLVPIPYESMFPGADMSIFFNYIVPPHIRGKVITTIHDMTYLRFPETMDAKNLRRLRKGMKYSVERSDHILTVSEFSKREIINLLGVKKDRVSVVYNAPSIGTGAVAEKEIHGPYILYVGTIEPRKNLTRLIRAFDLIKRERGIPHKLVLAGGKGWNNEEIYKTASNAKYSEDIEFTGYVDEPRKNSLYKYADVFIFPSLYEGFGIPPLEAMAFGCPVVTSNVASLPEIVGDAAELVDPMDEQSIAEGLWKALSDKVYADDLIQRGYEQIKKYTWAASARKLTDICQSVLGA